MRSPTPLFPVIVAKLLGGSGGGSVTPASIVSATGQMTSQQAADTLDNIGGEPKKLVVNVSYSGNAWSADKTLAELNAARTAGKTIEFYDGDNIYPVVSSQNGAYIATKVFLSDDGQPTRVMSILYNLFGVYVVGDGPLAEAPIQITCTMTSSEGGTWTGATFAELQAAATSGRTAYISVAGVGSTGVLLQYDAVGQTAWTSPVYFNGKLITIAFYSDGTFRMFPAVDLDYYDMAIGQLQGDVANCVKEPTIVTDRSSTSITLASAADNTIYEYGELTALTVTAIANPGDFIIRFTSGATATTTNFPASMVFPEAFSAEANMRYEINVSNGYALAVGWPTT